MQPANDTSGQPPGRPAPWAWLQLLRVPNLLTVPGDPVAGLVLAGASGLAASCPVGRAALAAAVSLLMYAAGLLWNDWFDLKHDLRERRDRPLPSGRVSGRTVAIAAGVLMAAAMGLAAVAGVAALCVSAALGAAICVYNAIHKRLLLLGTLNMGLCRGLSVLVGAAALGGEGLRQPAVLAAAAGVSLYIAAVTHLAAGETRQTNVRAKALLVASAAAICLVGLVLTAPAARASWRWAMTALGVAAVVWLAARLAGLGGRPRPAVVQRAVGEMVRGLVLIQATAVVATGPVGAGVAVGLLGCFALNALLARWFYAS